MKEQEWKEAWKDEMSAVHAPDKLIELTKLKVAEEEQRLHTKSKKKWIPYGIGGFTAIAAILMLFLLSSSFIGNRNAFKQQEGTKILLGGSSDGQKFYLNEQIEIERTSVLPVAFVENDIWEEEIQNTKVLFCCTDEGYYLAAYEEEDAYVIVRSKEKDLEKMKQIIVNILNN